MKNKLIVLGITFILILMSTIAVYANTDTTVTLQADKTEVKAGETFTVTVKATCKDGINGVVTSYSYDEDKLEYVSESVPNSDYSFGGNKDAKEIFVYCTSMDSVTSTDVYTLTFKVKEGIAAGSTAKVSIAETTLDSDAATDSEHIIAAQDVTITVAEEVCSHTYGPYTDDGNGNHSKTCTLCGDKVTEAHKFENGKCTLCNSVEPGKNEEEKCEHTYTNYTDKKDGTHTATCSKCGELLSESHKTDEKCTKCGYTPVEKFPDKTPDPEPNPDPKPEVKPGNTNNTTVVVGDDKDETVANKDIPKAGLNTALAMGMVAIVIVALVIYRKNQKYKDIK